MKELLRCIIRPFWALGTQIVLLWNKTPAGRKLLVTRYKLTSCRLPKGFNGFTIVQLTDLHGRCFKDHQMEIVEKVEMLKPDMVVLTGDMFDHSHDPAFREPITYLMKQLTARWPVYAVLGNHEMRDRTLLCILEEMKECGVRLLRNHGALLRKNGDVIGIAGVDTDPMKQMYAEESPEELQEKLNRTMQRYEKEKVDFRILLAHKPELLDAYAEAGADLVFSGHAHGGLLKIPFTDDKRLLAPGQGFLPEYTQGVYTQGSTTLILSSGMGGPRLGLQPEIVQVKLFS